MGVKEKEGPVRRKTLIQLTHAARQLDIKEYKKATRRLRAEGAFRYWDIFSDSVPTERKEGHEWELELSTRRGNVIEVGLSYGRKKAEIIARSAESTTIVKIPLKYHFWPGREASETTPDGPMPLTEKAAQEIRQILKQLSRTRR